MKNTIWAILWYAASSAFRGFQSGAVSPGLTRLKMSLMYVRSIKALRFLFLGMLCMAMCLLFLMTGLIVLHVSLFVYTPWTMATKMLVGLLCSLIYFLAAFGIFYQIFSSERWLKIFHAERLTEDLNTNHRRAGHLHEEAVSKDGEPKPTE